MNGEYVEDYNMKYEGVTPKADPLHERRVPKELKGGKHSYRLEDLAYARSGDKGNSCNIGEAIFYFIFVLHIHIQFYIFSLSK